MESGITIADVRVAWPVLCCGLNIAGTILATLR